MKDKKSVRLDPIHLIAYIMLFLTLYKCVSILVTNGQALRNYIWEFDTSFRDYVYHVRTALEPGNVYDKGNGSCFPPLAYLFYKAIASFCRVDNTPLTADKLSGSTSYLLSLILVEGMTLVVIAMSFKHVLDREKVSGTITNIIAFMLVASNVVLMAVTSGNVAFTVSSFLLIAFIIRESDNKILRELALILIAVSASFKIYPCVMGALYLKEHRYKEAIRLIIYGILFFFVPFIFFDGIYGFRMFLKNITEVSGIVTGITIIGIASTIFEHFMSPELALILAKIIDVVYFLIILLLILTENKKTSWKTVLFIGSMMVIVNTESGSYCLSYIFIPFLAFLIEMAKKDDYLFIDYVYAALFALFYCMIPIPALGGSAMMPTIILYVLIAVALVDEIKSIVVNKKLLR